MNSPVARLVQPASTAIGLLAVLSLHASAASAQTRRVGVTGAFEFVNTTADDGGLGNGAGWSGGIDVTLTANTSFVFDVGAERYGRDSTFGTGVTPPGGSVVAYFYDSKSRGTAVYLMSRLTHAFGTWFARPMIFGGVGLMHDGGSTVRITPQPGQTLPPGTQVPQIPAEERGPSVSALATEGGGGVEIRVHPRVTLEPYGGIRLVRTGNIGPKYVVRGGLTAIVHW